MRGIKLLFTVVLFSAIASFADEIPVESPESALNLTDFQERQPSKINWKNNPFAMPTEGTNVSSLELFAIAYDKNSSNNSAALVSGRTVRVGDKIGVSKIKAIFSAHIVLQNDAGIFNLTFKKKKPAK